MGFIEQTLNGLSFAGLLFLIGSGFSLTFGLQRVVNMAYGSVYLLGGYVGLSVLTWTHSFWLALVGGGVAMGALGFLLERGLLRRAFNEEMPQLLMTIGVSLIINDLALAIWGGEPKSINLPGVLSRSSHIGFTYPNGRLFLLGVGIVVAVLLGYLMTRTRLGSIIRAGVDDREMVSALGINVGWVFTAVFVLGLALAGVAGVLGGSLLSLAPGGDNEILLYAIVVVIIGGRGRLLGTAVGSLITGLLVSYGQAYFPSFAYFVLFAPMAIILVVRPAGLFGRVATAGVQTMEKPTAQPSRRFWRRKSGPTQKTTGAVNETPTASSAPVPRHKGLPEPFGVIVRGLADRPRAVKTATLVIAIAVFMLVPVFGTGFDVTLVIEMLIYGLLAMAVDLLGGFTGLISLGHFSLLGLGAYGIAVAEQHGYGAWESVGLSLAVVLVVAIVFGAIAIRVGGITFVMLTLALGQLLWGLAFRWVSVSGGDNGLPIATRPTLLGIDLNLNNDFYYVTLAVFAICGLLLWLLVHSPFGLTLRGIKDNEARMRTLGYRVSLHKHIAFIVSGFFAGIAGVLFGFAGNYMSPTSLDVPHNSLAVLMVVVGGLGTLWGGLVGAIVAVLIQQDLSTYFARWEMVLGAVFVLTVLFARAGIWGSVLLGVQRLRRRAFADRHTSQGGTVPPAAEPTPVAARGGSPAGMSRAG